MTLSTVLKNKMLEVTHLEYRLVVEIKNEDGDWIDFSGRDPRLGTIRLSTEKRRNQIVSSIASVSFTNDDGYFDYMDSPSALQTLGIFLTLASKFSKGFYAKQVRISDRFRLPDGTYEDGRYGTYRIKTGTIDHATNRMTFQLQQDIDFLKQKGSITISDGKRHHENKPVSYLVREILKRFYSAGVRSADFEIPDRIYLTTADGEPAFSHWGKPPERQADGRWRNDIIGKPTALMWSTEASKFFVGIGDEVWSFDPATDLWALCGSFGDDAIDVRGIYPIAAGYLFVIGWAYDHLERFATLKTARIITGTGVLTVNSSFNDSIIFPGEFVLRDTEVVETATYVSMGRLLNAPVSWVGERHGVNMPVPFGQYAHSGCHGSWHKAMGFIETAGSDGLDAEIPSGNWTFFEESTDPHGIDIAGPCYVAYANQATGSNTIRPKVLVSWGMKPNLCWAASLPGFTGSFLFTVETDGNPLGIRCTGWVRIVGYKAYDGTKFIVNEANQVGTAAPIYDLRLFQNGTYAWLYWIDVNWKEEMKDSPSLPARPIWYVHSGYLSAGSGGNPKINEAAHSVIWTSGDNLFAADDSEYAPITFMPYANGAAIKGALAQMLDMANVGADCFKLYALNSSFTTATLLGSSRNGWAAFTEDAAGNKIYFVDRDTGRVCYVDISTTPTAFDALGDNEEAVSQEFFELPQAEGLVVRTESSKKCLYGVSYPYLPRWVNEALVAPNGKYYLWKFHPDLTDRVELFIEDDQRDAWETLGLLAQAVDYRIGMDPEGTGFLRRMPTTADPSEFTIDLDSAIGRWISIQKLDGLDEIVNRSILIPYEPTPGEPELTGDLIGYMKNGTQEVFNGEMEIRSEITNEMNVTLHCIKAGPIGTAEFKYMIHDFQIQTVTREVVNLGAPRQLRLDNNQDLEVGMFVQVGDWDEDAKIASIEADGDVILDTNMTTAWPVGTAVIARSAEHGQWSTSYDTPDTYIAAETFAEIGETGLFLKFTPDEEDPHNFAVGDRLRAYNPGMTLERSRTKKYTVEDSDSIATYGPIEDNPDNLYISFVLGRALVNRMVSDGKGPHHGWKVVTPLFLQCKPHTVITLKSLDHLPVALSNSEKCYIRQVEHDRDNGKSTIILKAVSSYA